MEYERIHKVQAGIISPSKLRMKLIGSKNQKKQNKGSKSNSSRTSPSRLEDAEFVNNSLLAAQSGDFNEEDSTSLEVPPVKCDSSISNASQSTESSLQSKERDHGDASRSKMQLVSKSDGSNSSSVHPVRSYEDENLDYDSTSSFEFHQGERSLPHSLTRSLSRSMPSKWNDAEKWIMNRQCGQSYTSKNTTLLNEVNRQLAANVMTIAADSSGLEHKTAVQRIDFCTSVSGQVVGVNAGTRESKYSIAVDDTGLPCIKSVIEENTGVSFIRSVSMRDMGTEMTPIPSQEPSRTATPISSTTPFRSPTSSMPSTPRRDQPPTISTVHSISNPTQDFSEIGKRQLSEEELKLKTKKEIVALGVQLGRMNIAAWASKDEKEKIVDDSEEDERIENSKRAAAWEEAEKSKYAARFRREELRIQAWECRQKAKLEAEKRKIEARIEHARARAQAKMVKDAALARQRSEEKRVAAEDRKNRQAERTAARVEYIRHTGRFPTSPFICWGWF